MSPRQVEHLKHRLAQNGLEAPQDAIDQLINFGSLAPRTTPQQDELPPALPQVQSL